MVRTAVWTGFVAMAGSMSNMLNSQSQPNVEEHIRDIETSDSTKHLIGQYEKTKQLLESLLSSDEQPMVEDISRADHAVKSAFDALMVADLSSADEIAKRAKYLLKVMRQNLDSGSLEERLALAVERDLTQLTAGTDNV